MDDLKNLEGRAVKTIEQNNSGANSFIIIKFTDDSRLNISGFPHGDKGVAQLNIELDEITIEEVKNRKIASVEEEFDGEMDIVVINFQKGGSMTINSFNSKEDGTAGMELTVHIENKKKLGTKIVAESLEENEYRTVENGDYTASQPLGEDEEEDNETFEEVKESFKYYE